MNFPKFKCFTHYCSHAISYGASGTGKSVHTKSCAEKFYNGIPEEQIPPHKIIDIYDEGRLENCFYAFENPDDWMFKLRKYRTGEPNEIWNPQAYPFECYIPVCPTTPKKLPSMFKPFKIAFNNLDEAEFQILLGTLSSYQKSVITLAWDQINPNTTFQEFINLMKDLVSDTKLKIENKVIDICDDRTGIIILQKINKLNKLGLISDKADELSLNLDKVMRDKETITSFSFTFLEDQNIRHLLWGYLFRRIYYLRMKKKYYQYPDLALIHRELQNNAPARGKKSSLSYDGQGISLEFIKKIIAEPRDVGVRLIADSQDPLKIDSDVRKGFTTRFIFRTDQAIVNSLCNQFWLDDKTRRGIQSQQIGVWTLKGIPEPHNPMNKYGIQHKCTFPPPLSWCKKPGDLLFKIWKSKGLAFNTWSFKKAKSIISVKILTKKEKKEILTFKQKSLYEHYLSILKVVIGANPGISIKELSMDPLIKQMPWGNYTTVNRIVEQMCQEAKLTRAKRDKRTWALNLPGTEQVTVIQ